ncbi:MAG: PepSY-associated TM helix domain-containing protein [Pseudomonadota bacterium]
MATLTRIMRLSHIYSAAPVMLLMLFFAVTGLYLNHPELDDGEVITSQQTLPLPAWATGNWQSEGPPARVVLDILHWLDSEHLVSGIDFSVEYDEMDNLLIIDLAGPDGSTLVEVFFGDATVAVDRRELSLLATLNNLHRAKHVSGFWRYLSDFSAICMLVFCISGCWLIAVNKLERTQTSAVLLSGCGLFAFAAFVLH